MIAELRAGFWYCAKVFLALKVGLSLLAVAAVGMLPDTARLPAGVATSFPRPVGVPGWPAPGTGGGWHLLFTAWERFDALWFLRIADGGYGIEDGSAAFLPGWPLLIRAGSFLLGGHPLAAATILSSLATFAAFLALYALTAAERDAGEARDAVVFLAVFPTAFFLIAPYGEGLFLFLTILAFWGARRDRWWLAGLAAAAAAATRSVGILLVPALLVEAVLRTRQEGNAPEASASPRWRSRRWRRLWPRLAGAIAPAVGTLAVGAWWASRTGDWLEPITAQTTWQRTGAFPVSTVIAGTREAFRWLGVFPGGYHLADWLIVVPVLVAAVWAVRVLRPSYVVYVWLSLLVPLSYAFADRPLMSMPRFALVLFPLLWIATGFTARHAGARVPLIAASSVGLGALTLLFVNWYYIF